MTKLSKIFITTLPLLLGLLSCQSDRLFEQTPTERSDHFISTLQEELTSAPHGWRVIYFPRTDSLIFADHKQSYREADFFSNELGYGGRYFHMRFHPNGTVEMLSDQTPESATSPRTSRYNITQGAAAKLSFLTYNYLHELINAAYQGSSDFFFVRHQAEGEIIMSTLSYTEVEREYILLQKLPTAESWTEDIQQAYDNRSYFEERHNFQLKIHQGDRIFFVSDRNYRDAIVKGDLLAPFRHESLSKRYHLFIYTSVKALFTGSGRERFAILGSGYTGTHDGITFRSGIRYGSDYTFRDFLREGDHFTCELVKVYDPLLRTWRLESKHRYPHGKPTGMVAHIYPEK